MAIMTNYWSHDKLGLLVSMQLQAILVAKVSSVYLSNDEIFSYSGSVTSTFEISGVSILQCSGVLTSRPLTRCTNTPYIPGPSLGLLQDTTTCVGGPPAAPLYIQPFRSSLENPSAAPRPPPPPPLLNPFCSSGHQPDRDIAHCY